MSWRDPFLWNAWHPRKWKSCYWETIISPEHCPVVVVTHRIHMATTTTKPNPGSTLPVYIPFPWHETISPARCPNFSWPDLTRQNYESKSLTKSFMQAYIASHGRVFVPHTLSTVIMRWLFILTPYIMIVLFMSFYQFFTFIIVWTCRRIAFRAPSILNLVPFRALNDCSLVQTNLLEPSHWKCHPWARWWVSI